MQFVHQPLIIVHKPDEADRVTCEIWPIGEYNDFRAYGLVIADVIRHVASAFGVPEQSVFDWVVKEMKKPTSKLSTVSGGPTKQ